MDAALVLIDQLDASGEPDDSDITESSDISMLFSDEEGLLGHDLLGESSDCFSDDLLSSDSDDALENEIEMLNFCLSGVTETAKFAFWEVSTLRKVQVDI